MGNVASGAVNLVGKVVSMGGGLIGATIGLGLTGKQIADQRKNDKIMKQHHLAAERMYNEQASVAKNAQAKMDAERREQQLRNNIGIARGNRARAGAIFGDENLLGN
jgi:hypothetical protein